jgi:hypothetical protein
MYEAEPHFGSTKYLVDQRHLIYCRSSSRHIIFIVSYFHMPSSLSLLSDSAIFSRAKLRNPHGRSATELAAPFRPLPSIPIVD